MSDSMDGATNTVALALTVCRTAVSLKGSKYIDPVSKLRVSSAASVDGNPDAAIRR